MNLALGPRLRSLFLTGPLIAFLGVFFFWPLCIMLSTAVVDDTVSKAFPATASTISSWSADQKPTAEMKSALAVDIRKGSDSQEFGDAVRRLNSDLSGFRSLMLATRSAIGNTSPDQAVDLSTIDPRWDEPRFWLTLKNAMPPYTDKNLLAALDLKRDQTGIEPMAEDASANRMVFLRTFIIAATVTLACIVVGLPYGLLMANVKGWKRNVMLIAVLLPLWTSLLVRTVAWFILLQNEGLINGALQALGLVDQPLPLIFNRFSVVVAMTHVLLPFMVLPIYSIVLSIPANLMPAAASMGARPWQAFVRILLPLTLPGVLSGTLLVFMMAIGYYITPALVGGPSDQMISSTIAFYATGSANWGMAAALGLILLTATIILFFIYSRLAKSSPMMGV